MRKLFAILFSFQLMVTPVFANYTLPGTEKSAAGNSAAQDAYLSKDNGLGVGGTGSKGGFDFYTSQVLIVGTSAIGANIVTQCPKGLLLPSVASFMAGSLVHIMAEIIGAKAKNAKNQQKLKELKIKEDELVKKGDVSQKEIMEQQIKEEEDTLAFIKNRKKWMIAVTTIYTAAAAFAFMEHNAGMAAAAAAGPAGPATYRMLTNAECVANPSTTIAAKALGLLVASGYGLLGNSGGNISQYGTRLTGTLNVVIPTLGKAIVPAYNYPIPRMITFGVSAGLSAGVTAGFITRQSLAEKNISKLRDALNKFSSATENPNTGIKTGETDKDKADLIATKKKYELKKLVVDQNKNCFSKKENSWDHSPSACTNTVKLSKINVGKFGLPAINNVSRLTTDLGNALAEGNEGKAGEIAGEIGAFAARVETEKATLKAEFDKAQKKENKPTDLDKSIAAQVASLNSSLKDSGALKGLESTTSDSKISKEEPLSEGFSTTNTVSSAPAIDIPGGDGSAAISTEDVTIEPLEEKSADQSLDDFESPVQDVSKESEVSIFKQVSNRYILNYTKMFDRKKSLEDSGQTPKN